MYKFNESSENPIQNLALNHVYVDPFWPTNSSNLSFEYTLILKLNPNKLKLETPATKGSGYADKKNGILPKDLWEATQAMKQSPLAKELFGDVFTDHFTGTREWEWRQFSKVVTDWELKRYFEII